MTKPFFSICIAAYNAQPYIGECLGSIAEQDYFDFEVIIVDDGSLGSLVFAGTSLFSSLLDVVWIIYSCGNSLVSRCVNQVFRLTNRLDCLCPSINTKLGLYV